MKPKILFAFVAAMGIALVASGQSLIPQPQNLERRDGTFRLTRETRIHADPAARPAAEYLARQLRQSTGYPLAINTGPAPAPAISLIANRGRSDLGAEGYELTVNPDSVLIRANEAAGAFYGVQSLLQLLPTTVFTSNAVADFEWRSPCLRIEDTPRFPWRGFMLDVSRHFFNKEEIKRVLDTMALHKLNTFHWHLVDDHGWRIEIKKYPKLTEVGAWRPEIGFQLDPKLSTAYAPDGRYGGFYTQDDIREVVAYAQAQHITVVPEIEMPGHSTAALAAYPQFSCTGGPFTLELKGGVFHGVYCAGNDETFAFLEGVLGEVISLFPAAYVHIGGDEAPKDNWKACPKCQARMRAEGLKTEHELQSYFIRRIEKFVNARGRRLIGWSEILEGGLAQNAAVMDWIGGAVEAATNGHDVVMSPTGFSYFDYYQATNHATEPRAIGGYLPLNRVYSFEPVPANLPAPFQSHILGGQANLWTEYIPSLSRVQYMAFPRLCAMAEVLWSPKSARNREDFLARLRVHVQRLDQLGVNYRPLDAPPPARTTNAAVEPPAPYGPVPTARQLAWHELEFYGFIHFTVNTFTDKEWGYGDEREAVFNPTDFDADQIVRAAAEGGMKGLILTCKHHDGFCLWPSAFTEHSVKNSPWKNGRGDVVREMAEACRKRGLKFGIYLSPWDRNRADYGRPEYVAYFRNQLRELLTNYGPLFEVWFDGANGGDGFYGGAREKRMIDRKTYYGWPQTWQLVRELQPETCLWSDAGPDARWIGNEAGEAGDPCWATLNKADFAPGQANEARLKSGDRPGTDWIPAECDVSIRPGWFYHTNEDSRVRTPRNLLGLYFKSVGRGASLLLNLPPDRRGQIHENDARALREFRERLDALFARDLAHDATATASNSRGNDGRFAAKNVLDGRRDTYWTSDDTVTNPELVLEFAQPVTFNVIRLREPLPLGQRIEAFALDRWEDGHWTTFTASSSIGNCRLLRTEPITTSKVRLRIVKAPVCPAIAELGLFWDNPMP